MNPVIKKGNRLLEAENRIFLEEVVIDGELYYKPKNKPVCKIVNNQFDVCSCELSKDEGYILCRNEKGDIVDAYDIWEGKWLGEQPERFYVFYQHSSGTYIETIDEKTGRIVHIYSLSYNTTVDVEEYEKPETSCLEIQEMGGKIFALLKSEGRVVDIYSFKDGWIKSEGYKKDSSYTYELISVAGQNCALAKNGEGKVVDLYLFKDKTWFSGMI